MRRTRNAIVEVTCPECEGHLTVEVSPPWPRVRYDKDGSGSPPEPAEIESVEGHILPCSLANEDDDDCLYEVVMEALDEADAAARDREDDTRIDRERERREDWDPQDHESYIYRENPPNSSNLSR